MNGEKIKRTFALAYVMTGVTQVAEIAYNYLLYATFPVDQIGLFAWAAAAVVFFNMTVDLGLEPVLTRKLGSTGLSVGESLRVAFLPRLPLVLAGATLVAVLYWLGKVTAGSAGMLLLVGAQSIANIFDSSCKAWLRVNGQQTKANVVAALIAVLKLSVIVVMTVAAIGTIYELLMGLLVIRAVVSVVTYRFCRITTPLIAPGDRPPLRSLTLELLRAGVVIGGIGVLTAFQNRLDWLLISHFISKDALAGYSLANKFYEICQLVLGAALTTIYPWLCRTDFDEFKLLVMRKVVLVGGVFLGACGATLAPPLIRLLFADKFQGIDTAVVILMLAVGFMAASGVLYQSALAKGKERQLFMVTLGTTSLQALANLWMIPRFGITGAAIGMLVLVVLTSVGVSAVVVTRSVLPGWVVKRMLVFVVGSVFLTGATTLFTIPTLIAAFGSVAGVLLLAWIYLFTVEERDALLQQARILVRSSARGKPN